LEEISNSFHKFGALKASGEVFGQQNIQQTTENTPKHTKKPQNR